MKKVQQFIILACQCHTHYNGIYIASLTYAAQDIRLVTKGQEEMSFELKSNIKSTKNLLVCWPPV